MPEVRCHNCGTAPGACEIVRRWGDDAGCCSDCAADPEAAHDWPPAPEVLAQRARLELERLEYARTVPATQRVLDLAARRYDPSEIEGN